MQTVFDWLPESLKWLVYSVLIRLLIKSPSPENSHKLQPRDGHQCWLFCSTIGEVNACKPLIDELSTRFNLVFFTDRSNYIATFKQLYPSAHVISLEQLGSVQTVIDHYQPQQVFICEIPALPNDAPCKLSYDFLRKVKKAGTKLHLINAWLYDYGPACRQDKLERLLFRQEYVKLFDTISAQNEDVASRLIEAGGKNVVVTGNMKFDALTDSTVKVKDQISMALLAQYTQSSKPTFIAGCVSGFWEYELVIPAMRWALDRGFEGHFIIAPRHPEKPEHLAKIEQLLTQYKLTFGCKSQLEEGVDFPFQVLVLDTIGELKSYYSVVDCAYIGLNHNVLEPLAFNLPLVVTGNWNQQFPSYPVYYETKKLGLLHEVNCAADIGQFILDSTKKTPSSNDAANKLQKLAGATAKCKQNINRIQPLF
jgi:3-deoxy-D-manno-octulosonic-acid transferase